MVVDALVFLGDLERLCDQVRHVLPDETVGVEVSGVDLLQEGLSKIRQLRSLAGSRIIMHKCINAYMHGKA